MRTTDHGASTIGFLKPNQILSFQAREPWQERKRKLNQYSFTPFQKKREKTGGTLSLDYHVIENISSKQDDYWHRSNKAVSHSYSISLFNLQNRFIHIKLFIAIDLVIYRLAIWPVSSWSINANTYYLAITVCLECIRQLDIIVCMHVLHSKVLTQQTSGHPQSISQHAGSWGESEQFLN